MSSEKKSKKKTKIIVPAVAVVLLAGVAASVTGTAQNEYKLIRSEKSTGSLTHRASVFASRFWRVRKACRKRRCSMIWRPQMSSQRIKRQ